MQALYLLLWRSTYYASIILDAMKEYHYASIILDAMEEYLLCKHYT